MIVEEEDRDQAINSAEIGIGATTALCTEGLPRRGYRTQPRVSTLGTLKINGFALKGRECGSQARSAQLGRVRIGPSDPTSVLLGRSIWHPFRARRSWWTIPRVETLG
jgi:hypothetical protein